MPSEAVREAEAPDIPTSMVGAFQRAGYELITPAVIQPAGPYIDAVGEALRARTYVFVDPEGQELCLRPDLTVPSARHYLALHPAAETPARYCYHGLAFRYQPGGATGTHPTEFRQAGIESYAVVDREQEDASVLALTIDAVRRAGIADAELMIGDLGLFAALLDAIQMPQRWRVRLWHHFSRRDAFRRILMRLTSREGLTAHDLPRGLVERLGHARPETAEAAVREFLEQADLRVFGTRTLPEITERLLSAAADAHEAPLPMATAALIDSFTLVRAPASEVAGRVSDLLRAHNIAIEPALDAFSRRLELLRQQGVNGSTAPFSAVFGRSLAYYTGFVFQVAAPKLDATSPLASGGRYDSLLSDLGAPRRVPAIGSCVHSERLLAVLGEGLAR